MYVETVGNHHKPLKITVLKTTKMSNPWLLALDAANKLYFTIRDNAPENVQNYMDANPRTAATLIGVVVGYGVTRVSQLATRKALSLVLSQENTDTFMKYTNAVGIGSIVTGAVVVAGVQLSGLDTIVDDNPVFWRGVGGLGIGASVAGAEDLARQRKKEYEELIASTSMV